MCNCVWGKRQLKKRSILVCVGDVLHRMRACDDETFVNTIHWSASFVIRILRQIKTAGKSDQQIWLTFSSVCERIGCECEKTRRKHSESEGNVNIRSVREKREEGVSVEISPGRYINWIGKKGDRSLLQQLHMAHMCHSWLRKTTTKNPCRKTKFPAKWAISLSQSLGSKGERIIPFIIEPAINFRSSRKKDWYHRWRWSSEIRGIVWWQTR